MIKPTLLYLCDSISYIHQNCFQHQLLKILNDNFYLYPIQLDDIKNKIKIQGNYDYCLSVLKLRTLFNNIDLIKEFLNNKELFVYNQDAWEAYIDNGQYKNAYERICKNLNVKSLLETSDWWSSFSRSKGFPSKFVKMSLLPEYCSYGIEWENRNDIIFQGTLHPHRKQFFDNLNKFGINVQILPSSGYTDYLINLSRTKIYIHDESSEWIVDGKSLKRNALWVKEIEAAGRGCYSIRNYETELYSYRINELPTVFWYKNLIDIPKIIEIINSMSKEKHEENIKKSVDLIKSWNDWKTVPDVIKNS